ncbi:transcriptional regulator PpsR [Yoonia sp. R2331]|uniref:transcriptional regulator PpsR n=1 Tax=Yoonia sp. R2331 TaxID=3237238 RepID=UPI0034E3EC21
MTSRGTKYWNSGTIPLIAPDILGDIIAEVADLGIVVNDDGTVLSVLVNPSYEAFRKLEKIEGQDIRQALTVESVAKFNERFGAFLEDRSDVRPVELNHSDATARWEFPVRYSFHHIGPDGAVLMLGRDLRPVAEMQQQLVKAQLSLERDYEAQREYETRFRVLIENSADAILLVSLQSGKITDANAHAGNLLGRSRERVVGMNFSAGFADNGENKVLDSLADHALSEADGPFTARLAHDAAPVLIHGTAFRVAGERLMMCRISPKEGTETAADQLTDNLRKLFQTGPDAIVFAAQNGTILSANDAFLNLLDTAHDNRVRGKNLADFMLRGSVDLKVMTENAARSGRMRMYATKVAGEYGSPRSVEVAVTELQAGDTPVFAFALREANRMDAPTSAAEAIDENMQSVMELVGSATLKDIVAETTNVVEKMCIETAIELTMNNRVAAAEMLGLSRQSLYVKLRKFDIMSRD